MSSRRHRLEPADEVGDVGVDPAPVSGMTIQEAEHAASEMGAMAIKIPSMKVLEENGISFAGKGVNVGRGILILCAVASMEVEAIARKKLGEISDHEMFAKVASVHTQCVAQLLKNAELQMEPRKAGEDALPLPEKKRLEPMPE